MKRIVIAGLFVFPLWLISCKTSQQKTKNQSADTSGLLLPAGQMVFDYTINTRYSNKGGISVDAKLFNGGADTVYFLTWTCDGLADDFVYDTSELAVFHNLMCNASFPEIDTIAPAKAVYIKAAFSFTHKPLSKVNLGYAFNRVAKRFDPDNPMHMDAYRKCYGKVILRAAEKLIE